MNPSSFEHLANLMNTHKIDALALNPGASLTYLTGLKFHLMERPVILIVAPPQEPILILPELEVSKAESSSAEFQCVPYNDDPASWQSVFNHACHDLRLNNCTVGIEPNHMRILEYRYLETAAPQASFISADAITAELRLLKSDAEIEKMKKAAVIAQDALLKVLSTLQVGMSEKEIASELTIQMLREGCDSELAFSPIVATGPNTANPHAVPGDRTLRPGDLLLVDWGASYNGYLSDITRTFAFQNVDAEFEKIAQIVIDANAAGRTAACQPHPTAADIDHAARNVITQAGYGKQFTHRTGHGLGMEAHEAPFIHANNHQDLLPGMVFTVEPGIYLPGKGGVRFEDDVVITKNGAETLTSLPRILEKIG